MTGHKEQFLEHLKSLTFLYVEDEEDVREQFGQFLCRLSAKLITARNGIEGVNAYHEHAPDIIITDIHMPEMDGLSMVSKIREQDKTVPIIVLTAFGQSSYLIKSIDLGVEKYITKPVYIQEFQEALLACAHQMLKKQQKQACQEIISAIEN